MRDLWNSVVGDLVFGTVVLGLSILVVWLSFLAAYNVCK
jgi:hypothetical protein